MSYSSLMSPLTCEVLDSRSNTHCNSSRMLGPIRRAGLALLEAPLLHSPALVSRCSSSVGLGWACYCRKGKQGLLDFTWSKCEHSKLMMKRNPLWLVGVLTSLGCKPALTCSRLQLLLIVSVWNENQLVSVWKLSRLSTCTQRLETAVLSYLLNVSVCRLPHVVILDDAGQRLPRKLE